MEYTGIEDLMVNDEICSGINGKDYLVFSLGIESLWRKIAEYKGFPRIYASPYICADVKYFVVKLLRKNGYVVHAYGDSRIDLYMLREAEQGTLFIGRRMSSSLKQESLAGLQLIYDYSLVVLEEDSDIAEDIVICKSNSGIHGHIRLGGKLGRRISQIFPEKNTAILVLERGGRFFGDGIYMGIGGSFSSILSYYDWSNGLQIQDAERAVIVDSVIHAGKSIKKVMDYLQEKHPVIESIIAVNVLQREAVKIFSDYPVFTIRISANSFVGKIG